MKEQWSPPEHSLGYTVELPDKPIVEVNQSPRFPALKLQYEISRARIIHTWGEGRNRGQLTTRVFLSAARSRGGKVVGTQGTLLLRQLSTVPSWLTDIIERSKPIV